MRIAQNIKSGDKGHMATGKRKTTFIPDEPQVMGQDFQIGSSMKLTLGGTLVGGCWGHFSRIPFRAEPNEILELWEWTC